LLASLSLLAGGARAGQATIELNGKVSTLTHLGNPNAELQLAAKGVTQGTAGTLTIVLEDTTPGTPVVVTPTYTYMKYDMAFVDVVLSIGSWQAHFAPPAGQEATNFVQVTDNGDYLGNFDGWNGTALGVDTDNILSQGSTPAYGNFYMHFLNQPPVPATTDALVQDLKKYKTESSVRFFGVGGSITLDFTAPPAGPGAAIARSGQIKAAAKLDSKVLGGLGKLTTGGPDMDPSGSLKTKLLQDSSDLFIKQFIAAINKALKAGGTAPLGESGKQEANDYLLQGVQAQADTITDGVDTSNAVDRALRGKLLKALGGLCRADFAAHAKDVKKPDAVKLLGALNKAKQKFINSANAALDAASKKGVYFLGPSPENIAAELGPYVDGFVEMTSTGTE